MEIHYDWKRYKVTNTLWLDELINMWYMEEIKEEPHTCYSREFFKCEECDKKEEKPTEAPQYWYIETSEMKKSEYANTFCDFWTKLHWDDEWIISNYFAVTSDGYFRLPHEPKDVPKLSPQQWYDLIYKPDHDKAIDVVEVPEYKYNKRYANSSGSMYYSEPEKEQLEIHAKAIQQLQQKVFNK